MSLLDELMEIEHRLATGRGAVYDEVLSDDAVIVVPGMVLDKAGCVAAMESSAGWDRVELSDARLLESDGVAVAIYHFSGTRAGTSYDATLASSYRVPERRLFLHQQTPEG